MQQRVQGRDRQALVRISTSNAASARASRAKLPAFAAIDPTVVRLAGATPTRGPVAGVISALVNLGYGRPQAASGGFLPCYTRAGHGRQRMR